MTWWFIVIHCCTKSFMLYLFQILFCYRFRFNSPAITQEKNNFFTWLCFLTPAFVSAGFSYPHSLKLLVTLLQQGYEWPAFAKATAGKEKPRHLPGFVWSNSFFITYSAAVHARQLVWSPLGLNQFDVSICISCRRIFNFLLCKDETIFLMLPNF